MNAATAKINTQPGRLIRGIDDAASFPGLERIGDRFAAGLREIIAGFGVTDAPVISGTAQMKTYGALRADCAGLAAFIRFRTDPVRGGAMLIIPATLVGQLVDIFYGGSGKISVEAKEFTAAERRFICRIGEQCLPLFMTAWKDMAEIDAGIVTVQSAIAETAFANDHDLVAIQPFNVHSASIGEVQIACVYSASGLRAIPGLSHVAPPVISKNIDPVWRGKLADAVMHVQFPVRSIFARPELSAAKLVTLQAGDIIPVCLPSHLPVTVAGRLFAHGTVGEAGGRAAIRIKNIAQGSDQNE